MPIAGDRCALDRCPKDSIVLHRQKPISAHGFKVLRDAGFLEFEASTNTIEENEDRIASENNFYQLRFGLVVSRALSRQERIAGWRAAAR
jgi:hypothetical protein